MRRRLVLIMSWLAATAVATFVVWLGVSVVDGEVTGGRPVALPQGTSRSTSSTSIGESTTSTQPGGTQDTATAATVPATTTTRPTTAGTGAPTPTTVTTQPPVSSRTETFSGQGGSVTVRFFATSVELVSATPASGFAAEVDEAGPSRVRVEFTSDGHETKIEATPGGGGSVAENGSGGSESD